MNDTLLKQLAFIIEVDKIKSIIRQTKLFHEDRRENDAEHSWTIALMALILAEHANEAVDLLKTVKMLLIHDIVEIDSGDILIYKKTPDIERLEEAGAERIFGLLPEEQKQEYIALWQEFEARQTPEAKFAAAMDRIEPVLQNINRRGELWRENGVNYERIIGINTRIGEGSEVVWEVIKGEIDRLRDEGVLL